MVFCVVVQERERRSPALNLHMSTFPENSSSALQIHCHQEGVKVTLTHSHTLSTLFDFKCKPQGLVDGQSEVIERALRAVRRT